jgi:ribosomal protein S18 acetylase RimI-like enzyme
LLILNIGDFCLIFEEFNPNKHDYHKVAELMYSVDFRTYLEVFKTKEKGILAIEDLLLIEGREALNQINSKMYLILKGTDNIIGLLQVVKGKKDNLLSDMVFLFRNVKLANVFKFLYIYFLDSLVLSDFNENDLYVAEIAIDESKRGQGLGTKIIKKVIEKAKEKGFKRVVLDADLRNTGAIKLYESIGFRKLSEKSAKPFKKDRGMCNMEYIL